jgi:SAM-dependent methyltransferase
MPVAEERRKKIFRPRAEYISTKLSELGNNKRIGDIGAGFGIFLEELKDFFPNSKLIAIEPSKEMASICREKELHVIESSLEMIDPNENNFDLLTCFELFEHLYDPRAFLKKVYQILAPGGYIFITTLNGLGFDIQLLWEKSKSVSPPHHLNFFNPNSIKSLMFSLGFEITEVSTPGKLDWDIVENVYNKEEVSPGRFFTNVSKYGTSESKEKLQEWIMDYNFSSHMRIIAKKPDK